MIVHPDKQRLLLYLYIYVYLQPILWVRPVILFQYIWYGNIYSFWHQVAFCKDKKIRKLEKKSLICFYLNSSSVCINVDLGRRHLLFLKMHQFKHKNMWTFENDKKWRLSEQHFKVRGKGARIQIYKQIKCKYILYYLQEWFPHVASLPIFPL